MATGANFSQFEARGAHCSQLLKRRATRKWGKLALSLRVVAKNRPYFVVVLELGITKPCGLRLVWAVFRSQRHPPEVVLTAINTGFKLPVTAEVQGLSSGRIVKLAAAPQNQRARLQIQARCPSCDARFRRTFCPRPGFRKRLCLIGMRGKRLKAGWDNDYFLQLLGESRCVGPGANPKIVDNWHSSTVKLEPRESPE